MIGLTPFGTRAFWIRQRGTEVQAEVHVPGSWPFPPEYILLDIHRAYLVPLPASPPRGGLRELRYGAERVREEWDSGRLMKRSFRWADDGQGQSAAVFYGGEETRKGVERQVRIENEEFGYELEVSTLSRVELTCP